MASTQTNGSCCARGISGRKPRSHPALARAVAVAAASAAGLAPSHASADTNLATFGFETGGHFDSATKGSTPTPSTVTADTGLFASTSVFTGFHANANTIFGNGSPFGGNAANPTASGGAYGASANYWTTGDYWQFNTSSSGYNLTSLAFAVNGSNTGPRDFELEYSLTNASNASYTNIAGYNVTLASQNLSFNLSAITALDNVSSVYFRLVNYDTINVVNNGQVVQTGGTDRLDNIVVSGIVPGAGSGNLTYDPTATGGGGTAGTTFDTTTKNFIDSGLGTDVVFVNGNTVNFTDLGINNSSGTVTVTAGGVTPAAVNVANSKLTYTITGGSIGNNGSSGTPLIKTGAGTLVLASPNTYTGGTTITGGIVSVSADADLGGGAISLNGGELQATGSFSSAKALNLTAASTVDTGANNLTFTAVVSGTAALTKLGTGTLSLATFNSSVGSLTVSAGTVALTQSTAATVGYVNFGTGTNPASTINGTLSLGTAANPVELEPSAGSNIGGTGSIQLPSGGSIVQYATGQTNISVGSIALTTAAGVTPFIGAGTGANTGGAGKILNITAAIVDGSSGSSGVAFGGNPAVIQAFTGKVVVSGADTYSGGTTVAAGTLVANNSSGSLGSGAVNVTSLNGSSGVLAGNGEINAPVTISFGGQISSGSGSTVNDSIGSLAITGQTTFNGGGGYTAKINGTTNAADVLVLSGLTISASSAQSFVVALQNVSGGSKVLTAGNQYVLATDSNTSDVGVFGNNISSGALTLSVGSFTASDSSALTLAEVDTLSNEELVLDVGTVATPEPASLLLAGLAAAPLALGRRRRRIARSA